MFARINSFQLVDFREVNRVMSVRRLATGTQAGFDWEVKENIRGWLLGIVSACLCKAVMPTALKQ